MATNFDVTEALPATGCTREDIYSLLETMNPVAQLVSSETLEVVANQIAANLNVPRWKKTTIDFEDVAALGAVASGDVALFTLPAGGVVHGVKVKASTAFSGGTLTKLDASVGVSGSSSKYSAPLDLVPAASDTNFGVWSEMDGETHDAAGTPLLLNVVATGDTCDGATAGEVDVWVLYSVPE
jgi:hypothetical protein